MWTLVQWKAARRVDHFKVAKFNVRYRGNADATLKSFDQLVTNYHSQLSNHSKMIAAGEIVARAAVFAGAVHAANTKNPVAQLAVVAEQDLRLLLAGRDVNADLVMTELRGDPATWGAKQATVNTFVVVPDAQAGGNYNHIDVMINAHLQSARLLYAAAGMNLTVTRRNNVSTVSSKANLNQGATQMNSLLDYTPDANNLSQMERNNLAALNARAGTFSMDARSRIAAWLNTKALPANTIDLVYVPAFTEDDAQGLTTRPNSVGLTTTPTRPYVTIGFNPLNGAQFPTAAITFPTTLAHELLHALMDEGTHTSDANNLMAGGADRNGTNNISVAQMAIARNSTHI